MLNDFFITAASIKKSRQVVLDFLPKELKEAQGISQETIEQIWATAIALAILETKFWDLRDEWILISEKSTKFVIRELRKINIPSDLVLTRAKDIISDLGL